MKRDTLLILSAFLILISCEQNREVDADYVISQFKENSKKIEKAEYKVLRIDTFPGGDFWNNTGFALVERNNKDEIFKFSFYGKRNDVDIVYLYDNGNGFQINNSDKN